MRGRPVTFTAADRQRICDHVVTELAEGRSVARILKEDEGMCSYAQWSRWLVAPESIDLREAVTRAREAGATKYLEEIIEISDEGNADPYIAYNNKGEPYAKIDGDCIQRAKLKVYARERYAQMIAPRLFGQKLDLTSGGEKLAAPAAQDNRLDALLALAAHRASHQLAPPTIEGEADEVDPLAEIFE